MKLSFLILSTVLVSTCTFASIPEKYQTIVDRNSFALTSSPISEESPSAPPPSVDIKLTGFSETEIGKRVYFAIQPKSGKGSIRYVSLGEGEKDDGLEVLRIMENDGEVVVRNLGIESTLTLKSDTLKSVAVTSVVAPPASASSPISLPVLSQGGDDSKAPGGGVSTVYIPDSARGRFNSGGANNNGFLNQTGVFANRGIANSGITYPQPTRSDSSGESHSVVYQPKQPDSNPGLREPVTVDPATQYLNMSLQSEAAKLKGMKYPPLPPLPR